MVVSDENLHLKINKNLNVYIYIYIYRERERERERVQINVPYFLTFHSFYFFSFLLAKMGDYFIC